jgi:uroporphyrinogen-III synthase
VPLIAIGDPPDGGISLAAALSELGSFDWLIVTSQHGARRVGAAAARHPSVQLAAVGPRTARRLCELAGRVPAVVPDRHTAAALVETIPRPLAGKGRVLVVQADRADDTLAVGLRTRGFEVTTVVGYATSLRAPTSAERAAVLDADAVAFASGSAAQSWAVAFGDWVPPVVVAIGPTTRQVAITSGLKVTHTSPDHTVEGLASEITSVLRRRP